MTHYAVAQINIHEPEAYGRYMDGFMPVLNQYGGKLLAAPEFLRGSPIPAGTVFASRPMAPLAGPTPFPVLRKTAG